MSFFFGKEQPYSHFNFIVRCHARFACFRPSLRPGLALDTPTGPARALDLLHSCAPIRFPNANNTHGETHSSSVGFIYVALI